MDFQRNAEPSSKPVGCVISGIGLACAAGSDPVGLFGATAANITGIRPDPGFRVPDPLSGKEKAVLPCPVPWLAGDSPDERIWELTAVALSNLMDRMPPACLCGRVRAVMLLPEIESRRRCFLDRGAIEETIRGICAAADDLAIEWVTGSGSRILALVTESIQAGEVDTVLLGGADSLIDARTHADGDVFTGLLTRGRGLGVAPGEAGCWLALTPNRADASQCTGIGRISGIGVASAKGSTSGDSGMALASAIQEALEGAGIEASRIGAVVTTSGTERSSAMEWYSTAGRVWTGPDPSEKSDRPSRVRMPDESECYSVARAIGWAGAAQWPMAMTVACQRMLFNDRLPGGLLVCETGTDESPGAVLLEPLSSIDPRMELE